MLDAEVRIGELMRDVPKASGGDRRSENFKTANGGRFETKQSIVEKAGFTPKQVQRFETLFIGHSEENRPKPQPERGRKREHKRDFSEREQRDDQATQCAILPATATRRRACITMALHDGRHRSTTEKRSGKRQKS